MKDILFKAIRAAGALILEGFNGEFQIAHKDGVNNLVTEVDKAVEKKIVGIIKAAFPDHGFIGEEFGNENEGAEFKWVIDPIDGTVNFAHGVPLCCVSIALCRNEEVQMGAVFNPMMNELFFAERGKGAFLNDKAINVSAKSDIHTAFTVTGFPYHFPEGINPLEIFNKVVAKGLPVRRLGSAALDLCWVACGRFDLFWEYNLQAWDIAAGYLIVEEAGGKVTNFKGAPYSIWDKETLATNTVLHQPTIDLLFTQNNPMQVKIINQSTNPLPQYQTKGAAGMDLHAHLESPIELKSMERILVPTGLFIELPLGFEAQIRPRSGMAIKKGITVINTPGTIDSDYRGELKIPIVNLSGETQVIEHGERVAQMVIARHEHIMWSLSETLEETERGAGGFGHTGTKE